MSTALAMSALRTVAGVSAGFAPHSNAAAAAACGDAIDVPLMNAYPLLRCVDKMPTPGALMSM